MQRLGADRSACPDARRLVGFSALGGVGLAVVANHDQVRPVTVSRRGLAANTTHRAGIASSPVESRVTLSRRPHRLRLLDAPAYPAKQVKTARPRWASQRGQSMAPRTPGMRKRVSISRSPVRPRQRPRPLNHAMDMPTVRRRSATAFRNLA
jgi:hypothetical protein